LDFSKFPPLAKGGVRGIWVLGAWAISEKTSGIPDILFSYRGAMWGPKAGGHMVRPYHSYSHIYERNSVLKVYWVFCFGASLTMGPNHSLGTIKLDVGRPQLIEPPGKSEAQFSDWRNGSRKTQVIAEKFLAAPGLLSEKQTTLR
jgi:hypothetical protein